MLAQRLFYLRQQKKKTQADIASLLGITRQAYGYYEKGEREPDTDSLNTLANYFDVSVDYLLGRTDNPHPSVVDTELERLLEDSVHGAFFKGYLDAPDQKKAEMRQFLKFILEQEKDRKPGDRQGE